MKSFEYSPWARPYIRANTVRVIYRGRDVTELLLGPVDHAANREACAAVNRRNAEIAARHATYMDMVPYYHYDALSGHALKSYRFREAGTE